MSSYGVGLDIGMSSYGVGLDIGMSSYDWTGPAVAGGYLPFTSTQTIWPAPLRQ